MHNQHPFSETGQKTHLLIKSSGDGPTVQSNIKGNEIYFSEESLENFLPTVSCSVIWNPLELMISNYPKKPSMKQRIPRLPRCQRSVLVTMHAVIGFHQTARGLKFGQHRFGTEREHWKKVNITIKKTLQPRQPFCPHS